MRRVQCHVTSALSLTVPYKKERPRLAAGSVFELSAGMIFANMVRYIDLADLMHVRILNEHVCS